MTHIFTTNLLLWVLPALLPITILSAAAYYLTSAPLHRTDRARFLIDLIESALAQGQPVEHYIIGLAKTRDKSLGTQFYLLAAYLEQGRTLAEAMKKVPALAPPQLAAMLGVGESLGDYGRVLPACRELLHDDLSQSRASVNYQAGFAFIVNPIIAVSLPFIALKVLPVFTSKYGALKVEPLPMLGFIIHELPWLCLLQILMALALYMIGAFFLGGPRFVSWIEASLLPLADRVWLLVPWRRKRLQCDFSAMLALLLDAQLPEEQAVTMAAAGAANAGFTRLGREAVDRLRSGMNLPRALQNIDDSGEFQWRLQNASHGGEFFKALNGWHESLHARACQEEQTAAQCIGTGLLLLNAVSVALVAVVVIGSLAQITGVNLNMVR